MANLGSDNTPIEGESFGLPSGYSFDEENGDLVIRDTDGTVAMRRADGTWELESDLALNGNDISGVGAFDSESVNTGSLGVGDGNQVAGLVSQALANGEVWADDGAIYTSVQNAVDNASSIVVVGEGTFNESVTISTEGLSIVGVGMRSTTIDGGTIGHAIELGNMNNAFTSIQNVEVRTDSGGGNNYDGIHIADVGSGCRVHKVQLSESDRHGIFVGDADRGAITGCLGVLGQIDNDAVNLSSNCNQYVVDANTNISVVDNGTNNVVGDNS